MSSTDDKHGCLQTDLVTLYALGALPPDESRKVESHIESCQECRQELEALRPVVDSFAFWPTDVLRPGDSVWDRVAQRVTAETGSAPVRPAIPERLEPEWEQVAPGISCKLLASDTERDRVSMLVRMEPGATYPPHTHGGVEEIHLLDGEMCIGDRKLYPGDYSRAEPGTRDPLVWSETGCTCVVITSARDILR